MKMLTEYDEQVDWSHLRFSNAPLSPSKLGS